MCHLLLHFMLILSKFYKIFALFYGYYIICYYFCSQNLTIQKKDTKNSIILV